MFVTYRGSLMALLRWQWKAALLFMSAAIVVVLAEKSELVEELKIIIPFLSLGAGIIAVVLALSDSDGRESYKRVVAVSQDRGRRVEHPVQGEPLAVSGPRSQVVRPRAERSSIDDEPAGLEP
jgi:hypothetical protein